MIRYGYRLVCFMWWVMLLGVASTILVCVVSALLLSDSWQELGWAIGVAAYFVLIAYVARWVFSGGCEVNEYENSA
ncbi:MAG: hypothetical protein AAB669_03130 [Patescibacteria group bacterium]